MSLVGGTPDGDFFDQNPELQYFSAFAGVLKEYKKEEASKIMWAIYMFCDPDSMLFRMPKEERIEEIKENYYDKFDEQKFESLIIKYQRYVMDKEEYLYYVHAEKLDELTSYLSNLKIKEDKDFNKYVKIMDKLPKVWDGLEKVKTKMIDKKNKSGVRGGAKRSARERRSA